MIELLDLVAIALISAVLAFLLVEFFDWVERTRRQKRNS